MRNLVMAVLLIGACGGGSKYTIDDNLLAQVPIEDKQGMMAAQQERTIAHEEQLKARADASQAGRERDIAENDLKAAKLAVESAELTKKGADTAGDVSRKSQADKDLNVAELGRKAADAKLDWAKKRADWLDAVREAADRRVEAADAKYELEKAQLASRKGLKPSADFNVTNFEIASADKTKRAGEAKLEAEKMKGQVDELERKYKDRNAEWTSAKGGS